MNKLQLSVKAIQENPSVVLEMENPPKELIELALKKDPGLAKALAPKMSVDQRAEYYDRYGDTSVLLHPNDVLALFFLEPLYPPRDGWQGRYYSRIDLYKCARSIPYFKDHPSEIIEKKVFGSGRHYAIEEYTEDKKEEVLKEYPYLYQFVGETTRQQQLECFLHCPAELSDEIHKATEEEKQWLVKHNPLTLAEMEQTQDLVNAAVVTVLNGFKVSESGCYFIDYNTKEVHSHLLGKIQPEFRTDKIVTALIKNDSDSVYNLSKKESIDELVKIATIARKVSGEVNFSRFVPVVAGLPEWLNFELVTEHYVDRKNYIIRTSEMQSILEGVLGWSEKTVSWALETDASYFLKNSASFRKAVTPEQYLELNKQDDSLFAGLPADFVTDELCRTLLPVNAIFLNFLAEKTKEDYMVAAGAKICWGFQYHEFKFSDGDCDVRDGVPTQFQSEELLDFLLKRLTGTSTNLAIRMHPEKFDSQYWTKEHKLKLLKIKPYLFCKFDREDVFDYSDDEEYFSILALAKEGVNFPHYKARSEEDELIFWKANYYKISPHMKDSRLSQLIIQTKIVPEQWRKASSVQEMVDNMPTQDDLDTISNLTGETETSEFYRYYYEHLELFQADKMSSF